MKDARLIEKWLTSTPGDEAVDVVRRVLIHAFGEDALCPNTGDSHQFRIKHPALADMPGFGPYGYLSIPVYKGQRVRERYLRLIAQAIKRLEEVANGEKGE